jgi:hypothetical protein
MTVALSVVCLFVVILTTFLNYMSYCVGGKIVVDDKFQWMWKEALVARSEVRL